MIRPKVVIVDDHAMLHGAFQKLLEEECEVVGCFSDGRALLDAVPQLKPEIILLDIAMPLMNGLDSGQRLKRLLPGANLIFMTASEDPDLMREAFRRGAAGYLLKHGATSELLVAIREVLCGRTYVTPLLADVELKGLGKPSARKADPLTSRQREILQLARRGALDEKGRGSAGHQAEDRGVP